MDAALILFGSNIGFIEEGNGVTTNDEVGTQERNWGGWGLTLLGEAGINISVENHLGAKGVFGVADADNEGRDAYGAINDRRLLHIEVKGADEAQGQVGFGAFGESVGRRVGRAPGVQAVMELPRCCSKTRSNVSGEVTKVTTTNPRKGKRVGIAASGIMVNAIDRTRWMSGNVLELEGRHQTSRVITGQGSADLAYDEFPGAFVGVFDRVDSRHPQPVEDFLWFGVLIGRLGNGGAIEPQGNVFVLKSARSCEEVRKRIIDKDIPR